MSSLLIQNARVIDPVQRLDEVLDVLAVDGKIAAIGKGPFEADEVIDAAGLCLAPGLVDMHVHLRDPGLTHKEDLRSGAKAAAAGGFTAIACMPNTKPVIDTPQAVSDILTRQAGLETRIYPMAAITKGLASEELCDIAALKKAGAVGVTDDGRPVTNNQLLLDALRIAGREGILLSYHAEDLEVTNGGIMHLGEVSKALGVAGVDRASEDVSTAGITALAAASDTKVHIMHISTKGSIDIVRDAKRRGVKITCETAPHYFTLTHEALRAKDANFRMAPPLREEADRLAVIEGIRDGTIDCIATDHAPHAPEEKKDFRKAPNGIIGLETSLALCLTGLVHPGHITLPRLIEMISALPARLLGIEAGTLKIGAPADMVLFDPDERWIFDKEQSFSKSRNTPFHGVELHGRVRKTILAGNVTFTL